MLLTFMMRSAESFSLCKLRSPLLLTLKKVLILTFLQTVAGTIGSSMKGKIFNVGGEAGWTLPSIGNVNYSEWAASQTFSVGDGLFFNYSREYHNVMVVTKAQYAGCDGKSPISTFDDGETLIKLDRPGSFFFLCGVPSHCADGQKMAVRVRRHAILPSSAPSPSTSSSPSASNSDHGEIVIPISITAPTHSPTIPPKSSDSSIASPLVISTALVTIFNLICSGAIYCSPVLKIRRTDLAGVNIIRKRDLKAMKDL
ncbi:hypothetical protein KP509_29G008700 [Ceratopteris richardii]|uniref:Phytocyanin domain-containing protein n=1 Tax=Ceratopteris richardii TaxID=49495 RepID=A0A8T2R5J4_CERRI|nr:hypothetical protein KP509_29G008700 [Ceratopteris richardii]